MRKMSLADLLTEWDKLLRIAAEHEEQLAASAAQREALRIQLELVRTTKTTQKNARALAQESTRLLKEQLEEGQMMAIQVRAAVRAVVDPRSEKLTAFGVAPLRSRSSRAREVRLGNLRTEPPAPEAVPETPAPLPAEPQASPPDLSLEMSPPGEPG